MGGGGRGMTVKLGAGGGLRAAWAVDGRRRFAFASLLIAIII